MLISPKQQLSAAYKKLHACNTCIHVKCESPPVRTSAWSDCFQNSRGGPRFISPKVMVSRDFDQANHKNIMKIIFFDIFGRQNRAL